MDAHMRAYCGDTCSQDVCRRWLAPDLCCNIAINCGKTSCIVPMSRLHEAQEQASQVEDWTVQTCALVSEFQAAITPRRALIAAAILYLIQILNKASVQSES